MVKKKKKKNFQHKYLPTHSKLTADNGLFLAFFCIEVPRIFHAFFTGYRNKCDWRDRVISFHFQYITVVVKIVQ